MPADATPAFFAAPADFNRWLKRHHATALELWVGLYKRGSGKPSITWPESVDEALCYGWIDGVRRSRDAESYLIRFTPRRPGSNWSEVNLRKARALIRAGRMQPAGRTAYDRRDRRKPAAYTFENLPRVLPPAYRKQIRADPDAWAFFQAQPPGYRRTVTRWIMGGKREETRQRRLATLIRSSAERRRVMG